MADPKEKEGPVVIKKYGNRRLYDARTSAYITLTQLAEIIREGATVKIVDAKSEKDLTRQVLTQVILEEQDRLDLLPIELLHSLIRVQGTLQQAPFAAMLLSVSKQFVQAGGMWAQQFANLFAGVPGFGMSTPVWPGSAEAAAKAAGPAQPAHDTEAQIRELRERMDELLKHLNKK